MKALPAYIRIAAQIRAEWLTDSLTEVGTKLPTQEQLAVRYGVNRSTIIRALSKLISEGYLDSQQGSGIYVAERQPRESGPHRISMIVPNLYAPVVVAACEGAERRARQLGYHVLLASSEFGLAHEEELVEEHLRAGAQGILLYPVTRRKREVEGDYLRHWNRVAPIVTMDIGCEEWNCSRVQFDNYRAGYDMTQRLIQHGRSQIAFLHLDPDFLHNSIYNRRDGWHAAMNEAGLKIPAGYTAWKPHHQTNLLAPLTAWTPKQYDALAASFLALSPRPDALIAWTDRMAAALIQALNNWGVRVPEEVLVAGFDCDSIVSQLFEPAFPTTKPDFVRLGEIAVETLTGMFSRRKPEPHVYFYSVPVLWRDPTAAQEPTKLDDLPIDNSFSRLTAAIVQNIPDDCERG